MKNSNRHRRILLLMIASQALLTVFVLQWLRMQYREEKNRLADKLIALYVDARDEMIDTLLFRNYVSPVLDLPHDSILADGEGVRGFVRWEGKDRNITVSVIHRLDSGKPLQDTIRPRNKKNDMLLRSVKMIISHSRDTLRKDEPLVRDFGITPDTSVFKMHFHDRLVDAGLRFNIMWIKDSTERNNTKRTLYLAPINPFSLPAVSVRNYTGYLAGKILPQLFFGFFLIFLTAFAFRLSYISLRDHAALNKLRNEFISNMTHELKTPVTSISIALESLSKYNPDNDPRVMDEYLSLALSETRRLESLISRVLDHSVLEQNMYSLSFSETDLNLLISDVIKTMQSRLQDRGVITFRPSENRLIIKSDELLLRGVILNILDNSIKYCSEKPEINISCNSDNGFARIIVTDNGPGIPEEYHEKIFEKFFRVPSGNIHNVKGYGLGLNFASIVLKLHNGEISVRNLEKGCSFTIKLPLP